MSDVYVTLFVYWFLAVALGAMLGSRWVPAAVTAGTAAFVVSGLIIMAA